MSGLDLVRRLRGDARTSAIGIVVLTGHTASSVREQANAAGCDRFIVKPCLPDALAFEIGEVLADRARRATHVHTR